jgi:beta-glucosidase
VEALKEYATLWVTINEPNVLVAYMYALGGFPPGNSGIAQAPLAMINLARAHASAYQAIHELQPHSRVGLAFQILPMVPHRNWSPFDRWIATLLNGLVNEFFPTAFATGVLRFPGYRKRIPALKGTQDFFGLNYYTRQQVAFNLFKPTEFFSRRFFLPGAELSDTKLIANDPEGLYSTIKWAQKFNLPIIVTENGIENADDSLRPSYLIQHLHQIWRAVNFNWPVKGYFHWTLVDNFEWERGWTQRFGLWGLDIQTQARIKRPSADLYAEICRANGISSETVARFAPDILGKLFPD